MSEIWFLENVNLFKILCPHKFKAYKDCHNFNLYKKRDYIYFEDDASSKVYLIEKGKVKLGYYTKEGNEVVKAILCKGDNATLSIDDVESATTFILTIEPTVGDDPAPSNVHLLAGDFVGNIGQLTIDHAAALGNNFSSTSGSYILATPTDGAMTNENSGIWFLDLSSGSPSVGLSLPTLPPGWKYEGWAVSEGGNYFRKIYFRNRSG